MRFYLSIYFGWEYEKDEQLSLGFLDPCPIRHYIHFYVTYLHALMQVDHHSLSYLFVFSYIYFIPPFHSISSDFFLFSSCLMFDLGSTSTLYSCLFDMFIPLSSLFVWGSLGPRLMIFSTHCISCMRGMRIISLGLLSLVSFHWFHPKTLAYVTSRVLRTPWDHDLTYSAWRLTYGQYLRLVGDYFLEQDEWGIEAMDYIRAYPSYQWWILWDDVIYTGAYPAHRW